MKKYEQEYRTEIDRYLGCGSDKIFFYWKGRVALYAILKAMNIGDGDEVLVQGYTCVVVSNAIMYLGATPVYADIDPETYNIDLDSLKSKISDKTKVIICQNTYGLSGNLEMIESIAKEFSDKYGHRIYTIEDCTHGFGGTYHGRPNGISCDASFFSTQWSKPFTTGIGGFCVVHDKMIENNLTALNQELKEPAFKEKFELWIMYFVRQYLINSFTYWPLVKLYRLMSRKNLIVGSSSGEEVIGIEMPEDYFKAQSSVQFKKGIKSIKKLDKINTKRKKDALCYTEYLESIGKTAVSRKFFDDHIFIRYPMLVNNREKFKEDAETAHIAIGEWFEGPIYPTYGGLDIWKVNKEDIPNAMYVCEHIVNLPTGENNADKVVEFLERHRDYII